APMWASRRQAPGRARRASGLPGCPSARKTHPKTPQGQRALPVALPVDQSLRPETHGNRCPWDTALEYLIRDNDRAFGAAFKARVRAMGIRDRPTSFRSPWQNGLVERLIGSARRECTDHVIVFNEEHLRRILSKYASYYNEARTHLSLGKDAPCTR